MFKNIKPTKLAYVHFILLFIMLFFSVYFSNSTHSLRINLQHGVFDQFNKLYPREKSGDVIIVDIDEASLENLGQWPWSRNVMAELVEKLTVKGAKAIVFDGVLAEEDRSSPHYFLSHLPEEQSEVISDVMKRGGVIDNYDSTFAGEIKKSKIFVTGFSYGRLERSNNKPRNKNHIYGLGHVMEMFLTYSSPFKYAAINLPMFSKNAAGNGSFMAKADDDGILRRAGMIFTDKSKLYPSLSLEALRVGTLGRKGNVFLKEVSKNDIKDIDTKYRIHVGQNLIPVERDGILYVYYRNFCNEQDLKVSKAGCFSSDYLSAYKLLDSKHEEYTNKMVSNKVVLIGSSAEGLKDLRNTALEHFRPGVEIHANIIEQVLTGEYLLRPEIINDAEASFILFSGLLFIVTAPFIGIMVSVFLCLSIISLAFLGAYVVYVDYGILIDPVYASLSVSMIFIVSIILSYARAEAKRKHIRSAFGMYVAPDVMRDLERNPEKLKLGGENRQLTIMFTDIRKFTTISEGLTPEELVELMNEFLTTMTDIVMQHEGTVDKYIGDAMMAFWNAPKSVGNHEREACLAALEMQDALAPINEKVKKRAIELGKDPVPLNAGIGINTGECAVGNMGSKQRFAYSALGDAVNLSARLEGQTKYYGVNILIGESSYKKVSDLAALELDLIRVIGRSEPTRVYWLIGNSNIAESNNFKEWRLEHNKMLSLYYEMKFDEALLAIDKCLSIADKRAMYFYDMYKNRIYELKKSNLPEGWDGVHIADSK